ncbi:hypothetical protein TESG_06530 [Trichophyton tonsurans CBS 112818]|uniref:Uncharacterized protein n=1 Tax=Trichophyton tonsurans (strain CBS 112818) TaxID=647933 RepID=F2S6R4_TRIT1|nr:hypothetical protein TESG_06530 [Trichophyton tonsurans CBS 112818]
MRNTRGSKSPWGGGDIYLMPTGPIGLLSQAALMTLGLQLSLPQSMIDAGLLRKLFGCRCRYLALLQSDTLSPLFFSCLAPFSFNLTLMNMSTGTSCFALSVLLFSLHLFRFLLHLYLIRGNRFCFLLTTLSS